jgi:succinyl-diaminopimelate desuccinylase
VTTGLTDTLVWLCSIASPTGQEQALCDAVLERVLAGGASLRVIRHAQSALVSLVPPVAGRPHVLLAGHLDTVRTDHDGPVRIDGDRLYGPGASDMKSGLALMLQLAEARVAPAVGLTLAFYAGEEGPYAGNQLELLLDDPWLRENIPTFAVCLEPSDNVLQLGCVGTLHARVTFDGRSAHSARPWQGDNALYRALPFLQDLASLQPVHHEVDGLTFIEVTTATMAQGGSGRNVIPDSFWVNVNHRFAPGVSMAEAAAKVEALVASRGKVEVVDAAPSAKPYRDHPWVQALLDSGARGIAPKQAWTDVGRLAVRGIPAINFGPGLQTQAHQRNEWASVQQLHDGWEILVRWLGRLACAP